MTVEYRCDRCKLPIKGKSYDLTLVPNGIWNGPYLEGLICVTCRDQIVAFCKMPWQGSEDEATPPTVNSLRHWGSGFTWRNIFTGKKRKS